MFYSHEILTSRQYGVATIWLVATMGNKSSTKKVTRKAIQEVDVRKACGKILEPGAPIALRLQGNLLYGVSRVYNEQCAYMLSDAHKIQTHMHLFFKALNGNQLDPSAGQAKPENLLIGNDPDFVPDMRLPHFDLDALVANSQGTNKTSSQMSPPNTLLSGSHSPGPELNIQLDLQGNSDSSGPRGVSPFGLQGLSSAQKPGEGQMFFNQEDEFGRAGDWGMEIDENGNIIEIADPFVTEEPELPPLPRREGEDREREKSEQRGQQANIDQQGDFIMGEEPLPEAEAFPERHLRDEHDAFQCDERRAPARRKRKAQAVQVDEETQFSRDTLRAWQFDYLDNCGVKRARTAGVAQARTNAMLLTFGLGLANIGQNLGIPGTVHPLALDFSGDSLFTTITGLEISERSRGRRRSASEAMEDDEEQEQRRVKPRLEGADEDQRGRGHGGDDILEQPLLPGQSPPELGREAQEAMSDRHSSAMPWNRGSSAVPGSSIRGIGSAQRGRDMPSSPLKIRGNFQDIVRYSDDAPMGFGDEGLDLPGIPSHDSSFDGLPAPEVQTVADEENTQAQNERLRQLLDVEGQNFLTFIGDAVRDGGERRQDEDFAVGRKWVAFDDVFAPRNTPRMIAAQAFYHALSLATRGKLEVEQEGAPNEPFGAIWVGVRGVAAAP
ncbi:Rec8 like protein-domain-containing protein [Xylariaceae sp. FL0662B]|nr:Rec8 like protein-domain-containing protein [Xylariaceae sp. FL0662B]